MISVGGHDKVTPSKTNFVRNKTDYLWLAVICVGFYFIGEFLSPGRTSADDVEIFQHYYAAPGEMLGFKRDSVGNHVIATLLVYVVTSLSLSLSTILLWLIIKKIHPETPTFHFREQAIQIAKNFLILPLLEVVWTYLMIYGYTKQTPIGRLGPLEIIVDSFLWMMGFEIAWYTQHRLMHDNKFLWEHGHKYHHGWRLPEHMIGITNFAFDHIVEVWVTMSSSFLPILLFPSNLAVAKVVAMGYMVLAVFVHWDWFHRYNEYHLNHHYLVTKNYGSHFTWFDRLFGTYQAHHVPKGRALEPSRTEHQVVERLVQEVVKPKKRF